MASAKKKKAALEHAVTLYAELIIGRAAELHAQLGEALGAETPVVLDAGAVTRADTAGLQLLHAFVSAREAAAGAWRWHNVGSPLRDAAALLGLSQMLKLPDASTAPH